MSFIFIRKYIIQLLDIEWQYFIIFYVYNEYWLCAVAN